MAKKNTNTIYFWGGDYKPQRLASGLLGFKNPLALNIGQPTTVDLKMTSDAPLLFLGETLRLVQPGENITVQLKPGNYETGEIIGRAVPLWLGDYEIA